MNWYYESEGKPRGPVSDSLLQELLRQGKISRHTLVWSKGMADWKTLGEALEPPSPSEEDRPPEPLNEAPAAQESAPCTPDWESRPSAWWSAFFSTVKAALTRPSETFSHLALNGNWSRPLSFYILCSLIGATAWTLCVNLAPLKYTAELLRLWIPNLPFPVPQENASIGLGSSLVAGSLFTVLAAPLDALVSTLILHFLLLITFAARRDFNLSLRAYCYAGGVGKVLMLLQLAATATTALAKDPILTATAGLVSQLLIGLLSVGLISFALSRAHGISWGRALLAVVVIPMALTFSLARLAVSTLGH
jgi:hypothetical protein